MTYVSDGNRMRPFVRSETPREILRLMVADDTPVGRGRRPLFNILSLRVNRKSHSVRIKTFRGDILVLTSVSKLALKQVISLAGNGATFKDRFQIA